jgi:hypothetical protein
MTVKNLKHARNAAKENPTKMPAHSESRPLFPREHNPMSESNRYKLRGPSSLEQQRVNVTPNTHHVHHLKKPLI